MALLAVLLATAGSAAAQQPQPAAPPDPALLARMLAMTQTDRANILSALTEAQARASFVADELAKARAHIADLEAKLPKEAAPGEAPSAKPVPAKK